MRHMKVKGDGLERSDKPNGFGNRNNAPELADKLRLTPVASQRWMWIDKICWCAAMTDGQVD